MCFSINSNWEEQTCFQSTSFSSGYSSDRLNSEAASYCESELDYSMAQDDPFDLELLLENTFVQDDLMITSSSPGACSTTEQLYQSATVTTSPSLSSAADYSQLQVESQLAVPFTSCSQPQIEHQPQYANLSGTWDNFPQSSSQPSASYLDSEQSKSDFDNLELSNLEISDDEDTPSLSPASTTYFNLPAITTMLNERTGSSPSYATAHISNRVSAETPISGSQRHRKKSTKQPILSHFLYYALEHPRDYGTMIKWVDRSKGVFEFSSQNKEHLARAWGRIKNNRRSMTYPKMARALRKYIEKQIVLRKLRPRLQYSFLDEFLLKLQNGSDSKHLSPTIINQMYHYSRKNWTSQDKYQTSFLL